MFPSQEQAHIQWLVNVEIQRPGPLISIWVNSEGPSQLQSSTWDLLGLGCNLITVKLPRPSSASFMPLRWRPWEHCSINFLHANICLGVTSQEIWTVTNSFAVVLLGTTQVKYWIYLQWLKSYCFHPYSFEESLWVSEKSAPVTLKETFLFVCLSQVITEREILPLTNWTIPHWPNCTLRVLSLIILAADPTLGWPPQRWVCKD